MPNENIVRPAISSVIRCIASRKSTGPWLAALKLGDGLVGRPQHVRNQRRNRARRKGRRQGPALMFPGATLGNQQSLAEDGPQHTQPGRRALL